MIGTRAAEQRADWRLVLVAPLDTLPQLPPWGALVAHGSPWRLLLPLALVVVVLAAGLMVAGLGAAWRWMAVGAGVLLLLLAIAELGAGRGVHGPGVERAAALALLAAVADQISAPQRVELWVVGVGAAGSGPAGVQDLLRRYPFERQRTLFVAVEALSAGRLTHLTRSGPGRPYRADPLLLRLVSAADAADPLIDSEPAARRTPDTLLQALSRAGCRCIGVAAIGDSTRLDHVARVVERVLRLLVGLVNQLEREGHEPRL